MFFSTKYLKLSQNSSYKLDLAKFKPLCVILVLASASITLYLYGPFLLSKTMSGVLQVSFDGVELVPIFSKAQKKWRMAYATLYSTRAFLSLAKETVAKKRSEFLHKFLRSASYTVVDVEPDHFSSINQSSLTELIEEKNFDQLSRFGGVEGVISALETNAENGIRGDVEDIACRHKAFGSNLYQKPPEKTFHVVLEAFKDPIILILLLCAALSLGFGIKKQGLKGWSDGGSILVAVFLVTAVSALSNLWPKRQFKKLSKASDNIQVDVVRNRQRQHISIFNLVVGDVVYLKIGDQVPANGLIIDEHSLQVNESSMTGDSDLVEVNCSNNPFLLSGTKVADGYARMLVTSVGMNTAWGKMMSSMSCDSNEKTPLQAKLNKLTLFIAKVGLVIAFLVLVVLLVRYFTGNIYDSDGNRAFIGGKTTIRDVFNAVVGILATPVAIASAAIPEGLLLAVTITLAYSTKRMLDDQALVRDLSACEAIGSATVICTNKRGTLTLNRMKVTDFWLGQKYIGGSASSLIAPNILELLHQGVGLNTNQAPSGSSFELSENQAEKAIYNWGVQEMGMDIEELKENHTIIHVEDFNTEKQRSGVLIQKKTDNTIHVHQKGAPEMILAMCSHYSEDTGIIKVIGNGARAKLEQIIQGMAANGLQCIAFAHKKMSEEDNDDGEHQPKLEQCLTLLALVGLKDPCRPGVRTAVIDCQLAGVNVKMITGDDVSSARAIAIECGIIDSNQDITAGEVVEGVEFQNYAYEERIEKADKIRVIARASTFDKLLMVRCLKQKGHVVAVTGDSIGDAMVLREANIGLSLGIQGTDMAKENSNIVILDDNFVSIVRVLRWGRGIYNNIQMFTQFQLTVSIASLLIDFVTAISAGEPPTIDIVAAISAGEVPYATLQLLWVKLIVGTLAALALTIEKPYNEIMQQPPVDQTKPFITNIMWRNIMTQALYQITVLLIIQFKGESIFNVNARVKDTLIFNIFVLCQVFMIFNARKFEKNAFKKIRRKKLFWGVIGTIIVLQGVMVELLKRFANTERLGWGQWGACFGIAAVSWPIGWLVKCIPVPEKPFFTYLKWQNLNYRRMISY
uniref:Calcium-transporting ATPase n=1 Tax=Davidia involucrata TaxID=16924 RepID=A0A5B7BIW2_DAVIN